MNITIRRKKIYDMWENVLIFITIFIAIIAFNVSNNKIAIFFLIVSIILVILEVVDMNNYNSLVKTGEVVYGNVYTYMDWRPWTYIKAYFIDEETEMRYIYTSVMIIPESEGLRRLLKANACIPIITDKYMKQKGHILIHEFVNENQEKIHRLYCENSLHNEER